MRLFRREETYRSDLGFTVKGEPTEGSSPDHRLDESPARYSSAGRSPPEPASPSPAGTRFKEKRLST